MFNGQLHINAWKNAYRFHVNAPYFTLNVCPFTPEALHAKLLELLKGLALAERRVRCGRSRLREKRITRSSATRVDLKISVDIAPGDL